MFLCFLQYQSNSVIVVCTLMGTLQTETANSIFGILVMMSICQNRIKYWLKKKKPFVLYPRADAIFPIKKGGYQSYSSLCEYSLEQNHFYNMFCVALIKIKISRLSTHDEQRCALFMVE